MDYHERTVLTGAREGLGIVGMLVGSMAPAIFANWFGGEVRGFSYLAGVIGAITALFILICFLNVKENPEFQRRSPIAIRGGLRALYRNQPFRTLVIVFVVALVGNAFIPILVLYIGDYVVGVPEVAPYVITTYILMAAVSIVFWTRLSRRIGKKETWTYGLLLASVVFALGTYIHEGTWVAWLVMAVFAGFAYGCTMALAPSMMADVIDFDELETGSRREGAYFGIWSFIDKSALGVAIFIGMYALQLMGYEPNVDQPVRVIWTIKVLYFILPAVCFAVGCYLLRYYPISQEEHGRIRAAIEAKQSSETA
jgi:GPH family glycoside/pentoside/hexuronide:cation symporter